MPIQFLVFWGEVFWVLGGEGRFYFYGRGNLNELRTETLEFWRLKVPNFDTEYDRVKGLPYNGRDPTSPLEV